MKTFSEILADVTLVAAWLALLFLFYGDPDLWDKWHAHAMEQGCNTAGKTGSDSK